MDEQFMMKKANKKSRLKAIQAIIQKYEIHNQHELLDKLKEEYKIESNQPAISRDVQSLGLIKDLKTGCYSLSEKSKRNQSYKELASWARRAEVRSFETSFEGLLFCTAPQHAEMAPFVASRIEKTFSTEEEPVFTFVNTSGAIWVIVPSQRKSYIQRNFNQIFASE